jgi:hypothetical protein
VFDVRISPEAIADWLVDRDGLQEQAPAERPPDRPPDVSIGNLRAWVRHPGEEGVPYFEHNVVPAPLDELDVFPVCSFAWDDTDADAYARMMVIGNSDGSFAVRVEWGQGDNGEQVWGREYPKEMSPEAVWTDIEEQVASLSDTFSAGEGRISTHEDYQLFDAALREVAADQMRGFINPLPEGPIQ